MSITAQHAQIQAVLQAHSVITLTPRPDAPALAERECNKAGIVPFIRIEGEYRYCVMKPVPKRKDLEPPEFQLCKGTRMFFQGKNWKDIRDTDNAKGEWEPLLTTALREGIEEIGLPLHQIGGLFELGAYEFASASTGKSKYMWLFASEMPNTDGFLPLDALHETTVAREWLSAPDFALDARLDHRYILADIETRLRAYYKE